MRALSISCFLEFDFPFNQCLVLFKGFSFGKREVELEKNHQRGILLRCLQLLYSMKPIILFFNESWAEVFSVLEMPAFSNFNLSAFDAQSISFVDHKHPLVVNAEILKTMKECHYNFPYYECFLTIGVFNYEKQRSIILKID